MMDDRGWKTDDGRQKTDDRRWETEDRRMDIGDWLFSPNCALDEQIAKQIFDILPERGPIMVIMDRDGHCWSSNSEEFSKLNISESFL
jgi:hypothetical protein